jgi:hypothetical protein
MNLFYLEEDLSLLQVLLEDGLRGNGPGFIFEFFSSFL